jgi:hypothetical protein
MKRNSFLTPSDPFPQPFTYSCPQHLISRDSEIDKQDKFVLYVTSESLTGSHFHGSLTQNTLNRAQDRMHWVHTVSSKHLSDPGIVESGRINRACAENLIICLAVPKFKQASNESCSSVKKEASKVVAKQIQRGPSPLCHRSRQMNHNLRMSSTRVQYSPDFSLRFNKTPHIWRR